MLFRSDGSFRVTQDDGSVLEGKDALAAISQDPGKLSVLLAEADSREKMSKDGVERTAQDWMIRAQFTVFRDCIGPHWAELQTWPTGVLMVAYKMFHWQQGICSWENQLTWYQQGSDYLFSKIRKKIVSHHGDPQSGMFSDAAVKERIEKRAGQATSIFGAPITINWLPVQ